MAKNKNMIILGIHDGHNASAALLKDGKLICSIAEERLSRQKNHYGFPFKAIDSVLNYGKSKFGDIDFIAMSSKHLIPAYFYTQRNSKLTIQDYWKEQKSIGIQNFMKIKVQNILTYYHIV